MAGIRRNRADGHIRQRGPRSWEVTVVVGKKPDGKLDRVYLSVKGNRRDAEKALRDALQAHERGSLVRPHKTTVGEFCDRWLREYAWPNLAPRTAEGYEHILRRHIVPALGGLALVQLQPSHLSRYYADKLSKGRKDGKGGGLSAKTVRHHHVTLHAALAMAVRWGLLAYNPADKVKPPRARAREMQTFDEDGLKVFLEAAKDTDYYALFSTALFTGARRSELLALTWSDLDLTGGEMTVTKGLHRLRDGCIVVLPTKSAKSRRGVALGPTATLLLRHYRDHQAAERLRLFGTAPGPDGYVFARPDGSPWPPDTITHAWRKLARRTGFAGIRLHDARHTHATLMLKAGIHPKIVQERLGHSSISLTLDTYSHVSPGLQRMAAERFDQVINGESEAVAEAPSAAASA